jgi:hypothetical protein
MSQPKSLAGLLQLHFGGNIDRSAQIIGESARSAAHAKTAFNSIAPFYEAYANDPAKSEGIFLLLTGIFSSVDDEGLFEFPQSALFRAINDRFRSRMGEDQPLEDLQVNFLSDWKSMFEFDPAYVAFVNDLVRYQKSSDSTHHTVQTKAQVEEFEELVRNCGREGPGNPATAQRLKAGLEVVGQDGFKAMLKKVPEPLVDDLRFRLTVAKDGAQQFIKQHQELEARRRTKEALKVPPSPNTPQIKPLETHTLVPPSTVPSRPQPPGYQLPPRDVSDKRHSLPVPQVWGTSQVQMPRVSESDTSQALARNRVESLGNIGTIPSQLLSPTFPTKRRPTQSDFKSPEISIDKVKQDNASYRELLLREIAELEKKDGN